MQIVAPLEKHFSLLYAILKEHIADDVDYKVLTSIMLSNTHNSSVLVISLCVIMRIGDSSLIILQIFSICESKSSFENVMNKGYG